MSTLIIEVCQIEELKPHSNADRLELARVKNWWCVVPKERYSVGDKVVYLPPESLLPIALAERWGIAKYCAALPKTQRAAYSDRLRIRASRFRGERSFGTIQPVDDNTWTIGQDVRAIYDILKYEPPLKVAEGEVAPEVPEFHKYTDIENLGNFPGIFQPGEEVVVTEKIHGTNCRVGVIPMANEAGEKVPTFVAGSHSMRRYETDASGHRSRYWLPLESENIKALLMSLSEEHQQPVILFGEIFGSGVQDMQYGQKGLAFRAFDLAIDGKYLDVDIQKALFDKFQIEPAPLLYRGPFSIEVMDGLVDGPTTVSTAEEIQESFKGREGIVIKPVKERYSEVLSGRTVLKYISVDYHDRKNKNRTEDH
ncbi:RNA ligase (ATP) [Planctomycetales bacterium 10988]|nr:RNA ligase (ATP) [Planctomycetales bacterium 10988]